MRFSDSTRNSLGTHRRWMLVCAMALPLLAGCGTRLSGAQVLAAAGGGTVSLAPADLAALRAPAARSAGAAAAEPAAAEPPAANLAARRRISPSGVPQPVTAGPHVGGQGSPPGRAAPAPAPVRTGAQAAPAGAVAPGCRASLAPVSVGQVGTFSGVIGALTAGARAATAAWAQDLDARGGLACHRVELYSQDDGGDPARAATAVADLAARHHVVALVGDMVSFSVSGFVPALRRAGLPAVGGDLLAPEWFESPWMFPQGAGIDDQARAIIEAGASYGHRKLGFLYCVEVGTCGYLDKKFFHDGAAKAAGADPVYDSPVSLTQTDFTAQCLNARDAGVDLLGLGMDGAAQARVARSCDSVGYRPLLAVGAATFTLQNAQDAALRRLGMVSAGAVAPWMAQDTPAARAFHETLARLAPGLDPDGEAMLGWTAGKLLEAAVGELTPAERAGELGTASILTGLGRIHGETLGGLTGPLSFAPGQKHAVSSACDYWEHLGPDGWTTPTGSRPVCH